jgi:hypothetical protein
MAGKIKVWEGTEGKPSGEKHPAEKVPEKAPAKKGSFFKGLKRKPSKSRED